MSEALSIGWNKARAARSRRLYRTVLGINLVLHFLIGLAGLFAPHWVADVLNMPGPIPSGWTRGWGATLILVTVLYIPGWLDPLAVRSPNFIGILGRMWVGTVWLFIGGRFLWFALFDFAFALLIGLLYWRLLRDHLMSHP